MDSEGAASQVPVKMQKCNNTKKSQLFSLPSNGNLFHIALFATPGTCLEDWYPGQTDSPVTIWPNCPWQPGRDASGKAWWYNHTSGLVHSANADWGQHGCLGAHGSGAGVTVRKCDEQDTNQRWDLLGTPNV
eukprot:m.335858 g.335858  ORF g.335858 m.335858 type:complete len:132 (-) comp20527_c0_seq4:489-884(-)